MPHIFISYRREDAGYVAGILSERLRTAFGSDSVFIDIDTIPFGIDFRDHITAAVARCDVLLAVIGERWLTASRDTLSRRIDDTTDFVRIEIEAAIARNIPVIPILIDDAKMPSPGDLPETLQPLAFRNAAELRPGRDMNHHMDLLIRGLRDHLPLPTTPPITPTDVASGGAEDPTQKLSATLEFARDTGWLGRLVSFRIHVDGKLIGVLRSGDVLSHRVAPGRHRIFVNGGGSFYGFNKEVSIDPRQTRSWRVSWNSTGGVELSEG